LAAIAQQLQALGKKGSVEGALDGITALEAEFARVKVALDAYLLSREKVQ
jgi:hypothetical protein